VKTAPTIIAPGDPLRYTITVFNNSTQYSSNILVEDAVPVGVTVTSSSCAQVGQRLTCSIRSLAPGNSLVFPIDTTVDPNLDQRVTQLVNTATVNAAMGVWLHALRCTEMAGMRRAPTRLQLGGRVLPGQIVGAVAAMLVISVLLASGAGGHLRWLLLLAAAAVYLYVGVVLPRKPIVAVSSVN
jgi:uncharacterized repeat protein (TIGR01451 family)